MKYDCYKLHKDIDKKLNNAGLKCNFHIQKQVSSALSNRAKFVAITCLFRMSNAYRKFSKYIEQLNESCETNKNNPIIIRIYYDTSTERDILAAPFSRNKNIELVRYDFPELRDTGNTNGHLGTFGTFMRQLSLFKFAYNAAICTSFDSDMLLDYKEICRCIAAMTAHNAAYYALYDDNLIFDNIAERVGTNVFDDFIMATYIAQTDKLDVPYTIFTKFIQEVASGSSRIKEWLEKNKHIRSNIKAKTNFIYGVDEFFANSYLLPYIHSKYNVIGTRLYIYVRHVHYELYKAIKANKIDPKWSGLIQTQLATIFAKFKLNNANCPLTQFITKIDEIMDKQINIFKSLNINIEVLHQYLFLLIELKNKGVVQFSSKYIEYLEFNERTTYVDNIFIVHAAATSDAPVPAATTNVSSSAQNIWIVVPYADLHPEQKRPKQLQKFMAHMDALHNQIPILIVEQIAPKLFNKGQLYNIAIRWLCAHIQKLEEAAQVTLNTDPRIILHDVDILPNADMYAQYSAKDLKMPIQLVPMTSYFKERYDPKFPIPVGGGVTAIRLSDYIKVNGFPNNFAGWGGEDNAFQVRLKTNHIYYHYNSVGDFTTTDVQRVDRFSKKTYIDSANIHNKQVRKKVADDRVNWAKSGINQLNSKTELYKENNKLLHIKVSCDNMEVHVKGNNHTSEAATDVLIVVPFADFKPEQKRSDQLLRFNTHIEALLNEAPELAGKLSIIVAEQVSHKNYFNRGQLLNAGIKWFESNVGRPRFIILHDVDMLPDATLFAEYFKSNSPISLVPQDAEYKQKYGKIVLAAGGGVFGIPYDDFVKCNGYPNSFWSWGGEDDAFCKRLARVGIIQFNRVRHGHITHIDVHRQSHQTKMEYLRKNKIRSMMVHENLKRDNKGWRKDGYNNVGAVVSALDPVESSNIQRVKFELVPVGLEQAIAHNEKIYKELEEAKHE